MSHIRFDLYAGAGKGPAAPYQSATDRTGTGKRYGADEGWDLLLTKKLVQKRRPFFLVVDGLNPIWAHERKRAVRKRRCPWPKLVTF